MKELIINVKAKTDFSCGAGFDYVSDDAIYPLTKYIELSNAVGYVLVDVINNTNAPLKVKGYIENSIVFDSGYVGDDNRQLALDDFNTNNNYPLETITYSPVGTTNIYSFYKNVTANQVLKLECYAPLSVIEDSPNGFEIFIHCPDPNI